MNPTSKLTGSRLSTVALALTITASAAQLITHYEGTEPVAYLDPIGIPTICTGSTKRVRIGMVATEEECAQRLVEDTQDAGKALARLVLVPVTQGQYDALLSFTFNVGEGNLAKSTLLRKLNAEDCYGAADEFLRWDHAAGKRLKGLTARRTEERARFVADCPSWY